MLNFLPIMLLSNVQKFTDYAQYYVHESLTTAIMPQFVYHFIIFKATDKFLPIVLGYSALIFDLLCSILYS